MNPPSPAIVKLDSQVDAILDLTRKVSTRFRFLQPMLANQKLIHRIESEEKQSVSPM